MLLCLTVRISVRFWERALQTAGTPSEAAAQYFLTAFVDYLDSLVIEAEARDRGRILQLTEFLAIRIQCAGVRLCYAIRGLYLSIPKEVVETLEEMVYLGSELIAIDNVSCMHVAHLLYYTLTSHRF